MNNTVCPKCGSIYLIETIGPDRVVRIGGGDPVPVHPDVPIQECINCGDQRITSSRVFKTRKTVILIFGEMGSGKSYLGKKMAQNNGMIFIDGDDYLSSVARKRVEKFKPLNKRLLDDLVAQLKYAVDLAVMRSNKGVVLSQALYINSHREELIRYWRKQGYRVVCNWVSVGFWQNLKQLRSRPKGWRWVFYWLISKPWFERPRHVHEIIHNER